MIFQDILAQPFEDGGTHLSFRFGEKNSGFFITAGFPGGEKGGWTQKEVADQLRKLADHLEKTVNEEERGSHRSDISRWFDEGISQGASHMIVFCDMFDWDDFPVYVSTPERVRKEINERPEGKNPTMLKVMEVYSLKMDKEQQLNEERAFHYD